MGSAFDTSEEIAQIEPAAGEVSEAVVQAYEALPGDLKERWELFGTLQPRELAKRIEQDFEDRPRQRREILIAYLARRLGYSWFFGRTSRLTVEPLWDVLRAESFAKLTAADRHILWMIACTTQKIRQTLHPKAALAAIALWRFGDLEEQDHARVLLEGLGLPTRLRFLHDVVRTLGRKGAEDEVPPERNLAALARLHLHAGLFDVASMIAGLYLTRRFDPWYTGSPRINLEKACDRGATERPFEYSEWLLVMADAAQAGELTSSWLELPVRAAIRLTLGDAEHNKRLREHHDRRLYEANRERLRQLYSAEFERLGAASRPTLVHLPAVSHAVDELVAEVELTARENPFRAMRLLELVVARVYGLPLPQVLHAVTELEPLTERLLTLYVRCCHLDPVAVRFVREHSAQVDWSRWSDAEERDVAAFRLVGDYEATFGDRDAELLGTSIVHVDKDAAARVRYFHTSRTSPNSLAKLLRDFAPPGRLLIAEIGRSRAVDLITADLFEIFERRAANNDLREQVVEDLRRVGADISSWDDIGQLPITRIEAALLRGRKRDLLFGAATGGLAGLMSPATTGVSSVMDVPFILGLVADTCARHCWYYGFDPRENPELMYITLAVALGGVEAAHEDPAEIRGRLQGYLVRRSILLAAIGQGALEQIAGSAVGMLAKHLGGTQRRPLLVGALNRVARRDQNRNRPIARRMRKVVLPAIDGLLGASFNVSLVYDLCESAQAVLADRFIARKYPDWEPRF